VVDTMLGTLARWLRALGYDTLYLGQAHDRDLRQVARQEDRVLVTRDRRLALLAWPRACLIRAEEVDAQLAELVAALGLAVDEERWLSRCLDCNTPLTPRTPDEVRGRVPERVLVAHEAFFECPGCGKVYWPGSHADAMLERLRRLHNRREPG
jgi:uncharacterized protein with PIN domain